MSLDLGTGWQIVFNRPNLGNNSRPDPETGYFFFATIPFSHVADLSPFAVFDHTPESKDTVPSVHKRCEHS